MSLHVILFVLLALVAAISSVMMITRRQAIISALFLVINFFALAGLYLLLQAQFIAAVQVIVYAGAIMVLFLFVIMLINTESEEKFMEKAKSFKTFAIIASALVFAEMTYAIIFAHPSGMLPAISSNVKNGTIQSVGKALYTDYVVPFEAAGFLLLSATIGALILAKKRFD